MKKHVRAQARRRSLMPAHPLPDQRLEPHRPRRVQQRGPHRRGGHGRGRGPHPVAAHQRLRRGAGPAHRLLGPHRPQHSVVPPAGVGRRPPRGPVGGQLSRGAAHRAARRAGLGPHNRGGGDGRHGRGHLRRGAQGPHRGGRGPHPGPHRLRPPSCDRRQQIPPRRPGWRRLGPRGGGAVDRQRRGAPPPDRRAGEAAGASATPVPCRPPWRR